MAPTFSSTTLRPRDLLAQITTRGPLPSEYDRVSAQVHQLVGDALCGISEHRRATIHSMLGATVRSPETLLGHCYSKPHGYAGDFEIIDKIYLEHISSEEREGNWDRYFHSLAAPRAVRNRKDYMKAWLRSAVHRINGPVRILNVASGPARDLYEFFDENPELATRVTVDCVDLDPTAIAYAKNILGPHLARVHFHECNVFRFRPKGDYDLIWSAGLFDYFDDSVFVRMVKRFTRHLRTNGELVIGNFHPRNPSQPQMLLQDWILHHRTESELIALARRAGASGPFDVRQEAEGVNLFLHMR